MNALKRVDALKLVGYEAERLLLYFCILYHTSLALPTWQLSGQGQIRLGEGCVAESVLSGKWLAAGMGHPCTCSRVDTHSKLACMRISRCS
jgi:hypothetical protein